MYEWLENEISKIRTKTFHLVKGSNGATTEKRSVAGSAVLPPSYKRFVSAYGNAKLYRKGSGYLVQVFAAPTRILADNGEALLHYGRTDTSLAYFKEALLCPGQESPVFEWRHQSGFRKGPATFEEWLRKKCSAARSRYKSKEWKRIMEGPEPFSEAEREIVEARRKFHWRIVGISENGDLQFEVHNGSDMVLPCLSIGIRGKNGKVEGGIWLHVEDIFPGETRVVEKACYKEVLRPEDVVAFAEADPEPETRDLYWEFKGSPGFRR